MQMLAYVCNLMETPRSLSVKRNNWMVHNDYVDNDLKVRDHCQISGKNRPSIHRDYNINFKLNHKSLVVFNNVKIYKSHVIM